MNVSTAERNHPDQHNRKRDELAGKALAEGSEYMERQARAWGKKAIESIKAGNYNMAIARLTAGIDAATHSQYTGPSFRG